VQSKRDKGTITCEAGAPVAAAGWQRRTETEQKKGRNTTMNKKRTNTKRNAWQTAPPEAKHKGMAELTDADLEQVQGGVSNLPLKFGDIKGESTDKDHKDW
jgi:hypothetical protein